MYGKQDKVLRKSVLASAITATLGVATLSIPNLAVSDIYVWGALSGPASDTTVCSTSANAAAITFTMLDSNGAALANSSITTKGANQFQTPTCGTLTYDTELQSGTAEIAAFQFFGGDPTLPATAKNITLDKVPAGLDDGSGNLILANMLFDYNGTFGIPVSISYNAAPLLDEMDGTPNTFTVNTDGTFTVNTALIGDGTDGAVTGVAPGSDGTYTNATFGYLALGPVALATTDFDTTNTADCDNPVNPIDPADPPCLGVNPSADIAASSAVPDLTPNLNRADPLGYGLGTGIGGYPMQAGPFAGFNANFDFTSMTLTSFTDTTKPTLTMNAHVSPAGTTPLTITAGTTYTEPGATCTDAAPVNTDLNGVVVVGGDIVDTLTVGAYNVTYNCQDTSGNNAVTETRIVNVIPAGTPSISLNGTTPISHECGTTYVDQGATASDPDDVLLGDGLGDGDISALIVATPNDGTTLTLGVVNENSLTLQTIDYNVQDSGGSAAPTVTRDVDIVDTIAPVIAITGQPVIDMVSSTPENPNSYTDLGATATDSCGVTATPTATGAVFSTVVPDTGLDTVVHTVTYSVSDNVGNPATPVLRTVNVTRSQPVITLLDKDGVETAVGDIVVAQGTPYTEFGMNIHDAQDGDIAAATSATGTGGASGTALSYTISGTVDTATVGSYTITYTAIDVLGNKATPVTRTVTVVNASDTGIGNFTMLDPNGIGIGGTNDVTYVWDGSINSPAGVQPDSDGYTVPSDVTSVMTIASPEPFNGFNWTAKTVRVYRGPAKLKFDATCRDADTQAGTTVCNRPLADQKVNPGEQYIKLDLGVGEIGAHMTFDWGKADSNTPCGQANCDIDVVLRWDENGVWDSSGGKLLLDPPYLLKDAQGNLAPPAVDTTWLLVSTDVPEDGVPLVDGGVGDGINGRPMIDGPFNSFHVNFNLGPGAAGVQQEKVVSTISDVSVDKLALSMGLWPILAGLFSVFGLRRINNKK